MYSIKAKYDDGKWNINIISDELDLLDDIEKAITDFMRISRNVDLNIEGD